MPQVEAAIRAVLAGKLPTCCWKYYVGPPFGRHWFVLQVSSLTGRFHGAVAAHIDITKQKRIDVSWTDPTSRDYTRRTKTGGSRRTNDSVTSGASTASTLSETTLRLRMLAALTDTALSQLPLEKLIGELLNRALAAMHVDIAAILLLDEGGTTLALRAVCSPDQELAGAVNVPMGEGFAGRIAATKRPVVLDDVTTSQIVTPPLHKSYARLQACHCLLRIGS